MRHLHQLLIVAIFCCGISTGVIAKSWDPIETDTKVNAKPRAVLFIGNSYTYFNDLDKVLKNLAVSAKPPVKFHITLLVKGGATLEDHYTDPKTSAAIKKVKWDLIILQEQSMRPVVKKAAFFDYARKLGEDIKKQGAKPAFYMTWARQHKPEMTEPLDQAYTQMGRELDGYVAPVGLAWAASLKLHPEINLYDEDKSHPNVHGTYLTACVFYAALTGQSPVGLSNAGLDGVTAQQAKALQETAWETVQSYVKEQSKQDAK